MDKILKITKTLKTYPANSGKIKFFRLETIKTVQLRFGSIALK